jgi:hypothetical protein
LVGDEPIPTANNEIAGLAFEALYLFSLQRVGERYRLVAGAKSKGCLDGGAPVAAGPRVNLAQRSLRNLGEVLA